MVCTLKKIAAYFFTACLLSPSAAWTLEWFPEFQSLTETEEKNFEGPSILAQEYQSDVLTYLKSDAWEHLWLSHSYALDFSIGSVSAAHFVMDNRLKIHAPLNDFIEFRFTYFQEQNREREPEHAIYEIIAWPLEKIGFGFYGEPHLYKRDEDTGLALFFRPAPKHEIRVFNTFVDVMRLKRNDRHDTYLEPYLPYSRGLVGRVWNDAGEFLEYGFRYETKTHWIFPDEKYEYQYWKGMGMLFLSQKLSDTIALNARLQVDRKSELRLPTDSQSSYSNKDWRTDRSFFLLRGVFSELGPRESLELTLGTEFAYRHWKTDQGTVFYRDLLPHFWLKLPAFGSGEGRDFWSIGADMTWHQVEGPRTLLAVYDKPSYEYRLNLSYEFVFPKKAKLILIATADLDQFLTRQTWEGGCGQFQLSF